MPDPTNINTLLFKELLADKTSDFSGSANDETAKIGVVEANLKEYSYSAPDTIQGANTDGLAESVEVDRENPAGLDQLPTLSSNDIKDFWSKLSQMITKDPDQVQLSADSRYACGALGLIVLHCFKMINRTAESTYRSMSSRLNRHFKAIYAPANWEITLAPAHFQSMKALHTQFASPDSKILELLSIILCKLIFLHAEETPSQTVKGLFYGSCLTHIGMFGMSVLRRLEQTALAMDLNLGDCMKTLCTKKVFDSMVRCTKMIKGNVGECYSAVLLGTTIKVPTQVTWRFSRIYNTSHFSSMGANNNTHLILRCAAYLKASNRGQSIDNMQILQNPGNKSIFTAELETAREYFRTEMITHDVPMTEEAKSLYTRNVAPTSSLNRVKGAS